MRKIIPAIITISTIICLIIICIIQNENNTYNSTILVESTYGAEVPSAFKGYKKAKENGLSTSSELVELGDVQKKEDL